MTMPSRCFPRRFRRSPLLAFLMVGGSCAEGPQPRHALAEDDVQAAAQEVGAFLERYREAMNAGDTAAVRSMYTPDDRFTWVEDGFLRYESVDAVIEALGRFGADSNVATTFGAASVVSHSPEVASARVAFTTRMVLPQGPYEFGGMITMVLERQADGWRVVSGHTSTARERPGEGGER